MAIGVYRLISVVVGLGSGTEENLKRVLLFASASLFAGIACAILLGAVQFIVILAWNGPVNYNTDLASAEGSHSMILVLFMPVMTGIISVVLAGLTTDSKRLSMVSGAISGLISGIVYGLLEPFFYLMLISAYAGILDPSSFLTDCLNTLTQEGFGTMAYVLIGIVTISGFLSAYAIMSITKYDDIDAKNPPASKNTMRKLAPYIAIILICLFFAPPVMASLGISAGMIEKHSPAYYDIGISVAHFSNNTIIITNIGGKDANLLDADRPFAIFFNGKDVSNSDAINSSGLRITISPASGLGSAPGSSIILGGADISENNSSSILITGIFKGGDQKILSSSYMAPGPSVYV